MIDGLYVCPECNKKFICNRPREWVYYVNNRKANPDYRALCCSWTCSRKARAKIAEEKERLKAEAKTYKPMEVKR